ncbi:hypothetical protein PM082_014957 [Marasmius tenuissimus]|nr:hypothetical protein PM082_014957 [Marasmius tenuissimus]
MPNSVLQFFRFGVFVCLLTLALAGITIHTIVVTDNEAHDVFPFQIVALVAAVLTIIMLPTLGIISLVSKSSPTIWNITELPILVALSIIWLVAGIKTEQAMVVRITWTGRKVDLSLFCRAVNGTQPQGKQQTQFQQPYAYPNQAPSNGDMYGPNTHQWAPVQTPMNGAPMQQGQGQQAMPPSQSQTPVSTMATSNVKG